MKTIVSGGDEKKDIINSSFSNSEKVIWQLAVSGKINKWDIKKKTNMPYPRVHETIVILEKQKLVKKVGEKTVKNKLPSPIYGLTFKGALTYLSMQKLTELDFVGFQGESKEEFKKRYLKSHKKRSNEFEKLQNLLKTFGKDFDYPIFNQIDWLLDNYGRMILPIILKLATKQITNPSLTIEESKQQQKKDEKHLLRSIDTIKNRPFLQKMLTYTDDGKGRVYKEYDVLKDEEIRLEYLRRYIEMTLQAEKEYLRKSFAYDFFINLTYWKKNKQDGNEVLAKFALELLEEKRKALAPLERIVEKLGENN